MSTAFLSLLHHHRRCRRRRRRRLSLFFVVALAMFHSGDRYVRLTRDG